MTVEDAKTDGEEDLNARRPAASDEELTAGGKAGQRPDHVPDLGDGARFRTKKGGPFSSEIPQGDR